MARTDDNHHAQENSHDLLTPEEVGRQLHVTSDQVRHLIRRGEVDAVNVATKGGRNCWYQIERTTGERE